METTKDYLAALDRIYATGIKYKAITEGPVSGPESVVQTARGPVKTLARIVSEVPSAQADRASAEVAAAAAVAQAGNASESAAAAQAARAAAELARDASFAQGKKYVDEPTGRASVADGEAFLVQGAGDIAAFEYRRVSASASTLIALYPSAGSVQQLRTDLETRVTQQEIMDPTIVGAETDPDGNAVTLTHTDGTKEIPKAKLGTATATKFYPISIEDDATDTYSGSAIGYERVFTDPAGFMSLGFRSDGAVEIPKLITPGLGAAWNTFGLGDADSVAFVGDSYTASHYTVKDKAYISRLSSLTGYRCRNFGISGNDALDMNYRIITDAVYPDGAYFSAMRARFVCILSYTNDTDFRGADLTMYQRNIERLVETVIASGAEPILCSEFPATTTTYAILRNIADRYGIRFVDVASLNYEWGNLQLGPFFQGHPGTRTNAVFWYNLYETFRALPKPDRGIKIYRRRAGFAVSAISDLLFSSVVDKQARFKELTVSHYRLTDTQLPRYDELNSGISWSFTLESDEYSKIESGAGVAISDYALVEVTLPGTARTIDQVMLTLGLPSGVQVYVRDYQDVASSPVGKSQGASPTQPDYLSKWNKSRGAWRSLGQYSAPITMAKVNLRNSMRGDRMELLLYKSSGFSITACQVGYQGAGGKEPNLRTTPPRLLDTQLLPAPTVSAADLTAAWTVTGAPATLVPIDNVNSPRNPANTASPVSAVCVLTATDMIGRSLTLATPGLAGKRYAVTVYARYFPKAFVDRSNPLYSSLDSAQVIDRIANPSSAPIDADSHDFRTLRMEYAFAASIDPTVGGGELDEFASLYWRPVVFYVDMPPAPLGTGAFSFRLSCPDGEIQVAKVLIQEVK